MERTKTNEQIQQEIEAKLNEMSVEEREAFLAAEEAKDKLMCIKLSRKLNANIEVIPNDLHHIKVNGEVMGYNEYAEWQEARQAELNPTEEKNEDDEAEDGVEFF